MLGKGTFREVDGGNAGEGSMRCGVMNKRHDGLYAFAQSMCQLLHLCRLCCLDELLDR